jgi:hypothetical protein
MWGGKIKEWRFAVLLDSFGRLSVQDQLALITSVVLIIMIGKIPMCPSELAH